MNKILKLAGVPMLAIVAATNANAAGYTCEELIEYTSCNPGYWLSTTTTDNRCPEGRVPTDTTYCWTGEYRDGDLTEHITGLTEDECLELCYDDTCVFYDVGEACYSDEVYESVGGMDIKDVVVAPVGSLTSTSQCNECPAGSSCAGGDAAAVACAAGSYQPNTKQTSCINAPVGNYVAGTGATSYTACSAGTYQPQSGQTSCVECPAGSYCGTAGLSAVSGQCAVGSYAWAGAVSCMSCPSTGLTDINGAVVNATTLSAGAASISACIVGPDAQFKDDAGIYHFKSNCEYDIPTFEEACLAYQKANPEKAAECDTSDPDYSPYCDYGMGGLVYDETTGAIGCHVDDGSVCGGDTDLDKIKTNCALTGGVYNPNTTFCDCPSGTWQCGFDAGTTDPDMEYEWGCFLL